MLLLLGLTWAGSTATLVTQTAAAASQDEWLWNTAAPTASLGKVNSSVAAAFIVSVLHSLSDTVSSGLDAIGCRRK